MRLILAALVMMIALAGSSVSWGQSSHPLAPKTASPTPSAEVSEPGLWSGFVGYVYRMQRDLHRQLAGAVRAVRDESLLEASLGLAFLSFMYGIFHAAGPGHGKAVISAYVLANGSQLRRGVFLSFASAFAQAITAICLVGVISLGLAALTITTREASAFLERGSFVLIAALGFWLLWRTLRPHDHSHCGHGHDHDHRHRHHEDHGGHEAHHGSAPLRGSNLRDGAGLIFAVGIRPCTGAVLVLMFAQALGIFFVGVWATLAMSLGTAITVSALAVLTIASRDLAERLLRRNSQWMERLQKVLGVAASLALILLGASLYFGPGAAQSPL